MEDELWMRKIKERLEDYSEPLPVSGWERLEKDLSASKPPVVVQRRIIPFRRWTVAAAAVLLVAVSSVSVWLLQSPMGEEVRSTAVPALAAGAYKRKLQNLAIACKNKWRQQVCTTVLYWHNNCT